MARGGRVALQTILGGLSGGLAGYAQQRELERKREREQAMDLINILQAGGRPEGPVPALAGPAPTGIGPSGKLTSKAAPPPPMAQETAVNVPGLGRMLIGGPTLAERRADTRAMAAAEAERGAQEKGRAALQETLSGFTETELPQRYRTAVLSGATDLESALAQVRANRPSPGPTERPLGMREVNESVGALVRSMTLSGVVERDPELGTMVKRRYTPEEITNAAEEYRRTLMQLWGIAGGPPAAVRGEAAPAAATPGGRNMFNLDLGRGGRPASLQPDTRNLSPNVQRWRTLTGSELPMPAGVDLRAYETDANYRRMVNKAVNRGVGTRQLPEE